MQTMKFIYISVLLLVFSQNSFCEISLPDILSDGMILQRNQEVPIWGKANAGQKVIIQFKGQNVSTVANDNGDWQVTLSPMTHSDAPEIMTIIGEEMIQLKNILIGEVWFCSGQSNMQWEVQQSNGGEEAIASANYPFIRLFDVDREVGFKRREGKLAMWQKADPESVRSFSAVGYFFALKLHQELGIPVGMINSSFGGTQAEAWTPREYLASSPELLPCIEREKIWDAERAEVQAAFDIRVAKRNENVKKAKANNTKMPSRLRVPDALRPQRIAGSIYTNMVEPLLPYGVKGILWYQGESNEGRAEQYELLLSTMIRSWRDSWNSKDLPFAIVQLPNFRAPKEEPADEAWSHVRDSQLKVHKSTANTGLIVTIDIGETKNIHPGNKIDVGDRLFRWAMSDVYNSDIQGSGPILKKSKLKKRKVILCFDEVGDGLTTSDGKNPESFAISGADQKWVWANAEIKGKNKIVVWSDTVIDPVAVRYAFNNNPKNPNLINKSGLPASPFRTDEWKGPTAGKR